MKILVVDWKGEKYMIIDTHLHIGGEAVGFEMNEQMVVEAMEKYQIAKEQEVYKSKIGSRDDTPSGIIA